MKNRELTVEEQNHPLWAAHQLFMQEEMPKFEENLAKAIQGNKLAARRARKQIQGIKTYMQETRVALLAMTKKEA